MSKTLKDYPVSFPYGATSSPYSAGNPHHGDDIAAPCGTPIIVSGKNIGLVGTTGFSTGCHCHIDKNRQLWAFGGYVKPTNYYNLKGVVIFAEDAGTAGLTVVIETDDGWFYRFLHMSKINVKVGDKIGGEVKTTKTTAIWLVRTLTHEHSPPQKIWENWVGLNDRQLTARLKNVYESAWFKEHTRRVKTPSPSDATVLNKGLYEVK